jgi:hypothetical protein
MTQPPEKHPKTSDIECLKCGAFNIPENHVCGRCGANLPIVYDEEGNIFSWKGHQRWDETRNQGARRSTLSMGWIFRFALILFAVFLAFWIIRHR